MSNKYQIHNLFKAIFGLTILSLCNAPIVNADSVQEIYVANNPVAAVGNSVVLKVNYNTSDGEDNLTGIGFRLHYSSDQLTFSQTQNILSNDLISNSGGPYSDDSNLDNDSNTDSYLSFSWASLFGNWPNQSLPVELFEATFLVSDTINTSITPSTNINFTIISSTVGYEFQPYNYQMPIVKTSWDIDGNGTVDALTDGLLMLRYIFELRGNDLINNAVATDSPMNYQEVEQSLLNSLAIADIDDNGNVDALTDGLLLLRYLFDLKGNILIERAVSVNANRTSHFDIENYLKKFMPGEIHDGIENEDHCLNEGGSEHEEHVDCHQSTDSAVFTGVFDGFLADPETNTFEWPSDASSWAGVANENQALYPIAVPENTQINFLASSAEPASVYFRLEYKPYPDVNPQYETDSVVINGPCQAYSIDLPSQGANTFSSYLLFIEERDIPVTVSNVVIGGDAPSCDSISDDNNSTDFNDEVVIFRDGEFGPDFDIGMQGYDEALEFLSCTLPGDCPSINFGLTEDDERGSVIFVEHGDSGLMNGIGIRSTIPIDMSGAYEAGELSFDIWSETGVTIVVNIECFYPCRSFPVNFENVGQGEWETITLTDIHLNTGYLNEISMSNVSAFIISAEDGLTNQSFRLDNIVWNCEISCKDPERVDVDTDISGVWQNANKIGSMGVGPYQGDTSYWVVDDFELSRRSCFFDNTYTFVRDDNSHNHIGNFYQEMDRLTWIEAWASPSGQEGCSDPTLLTLANGSDYKWDGLESGMSYELNFQQAQLSLYGEGAHMGIPRIINNGDASLSGPASIITYNIESFSNCFMSLNILGENELWWHFELERVKKADGTPVEDDPEYCSGGYYDFSNYGLRDLHLAGSDYVMLEVGDEYHDFGVVVDISDESLLYDLDPYAEGLQWLITQGLDEVDTSVEGTYEILYFAQDIYGTQKFISRTVEVFKDIAAPIITIPGPNPIVILAGEDFELPNVSFIDEYDFSQNDPPQNTLSIDGLFNVNVPGAYTITYTATDNSGNQTTKDLTIIVEPDYQDEVVIFQNGTTTAEWQPGLNGYDQDNGWGACPDPAACPNLDFGIVNDSERGDVVFVSHADTEALAGFFIETQTPNDLRGAAVNGKLEFDIWSESGVSVNVSADCVYPCQGGPVLIENVGAGAWETIAIPASQLMTNGFNSITMENVSTFSISADGMRNTSFRLDNIKWLCEFTCTGTD